MRRSRKFCQKRSNFDNIFFEADDKIDPNTTIRGPSWACQGNAIQMAFCWSANDDPPLDAGLVALLFFSGGIGASIAKKPYIFVIFQGVRTPCLPPPP